MNAANANAERTAQTQRPLRSDNNVVADRKVTAVNHLDGATGNTGSNDESICHRLKRPDLRRGTVVDNRALGIRRREVRRPISRARTNYLYRPGLAKSYPARTGTRAQPKTN